MNYIEVSGELDNVDKGILSPPQRESTRTPVLQQDARNHTTTDISEKVGVSSSTVANRINKHEDEDVITGYDPTIDYEKTGIDHHLLVFGTAPFGERQTVADEIMDVYRVVSLRELLTGETNLTVEIIGRTPQEIERTLSGLDSVGVDREGVELMKGNGHSPTTTSEESSWTTRRLADFQAD